MMANLDQAPGPGFTISTSGNKHVNWPWKVHFTGYRKKQVLSECIVSHSKIKILSTEDDSVF